IIILSLVIITKEIYPQNLFSVEPEVRVRIIDSLKELKVSFRGQWNMIANTNSDIISEENGLVVFSIEDEKIHIQKNKDHFNTGVDRLFLTCSTDNGSITVSDVPFGLGWWWEGKENRTYEGEISIYTGAKNNLEVVVKLSLEDYLKGVVPYEMGNDSPLESLKAQAVAARSEAVIALTSKLYNGEHHDLTSDVECQVFSGNKKRTFLTDRAVNETKGVILSEDGHPINAYYASNCGGHSEFIKNVWPDRPDPESYQIALVDKKERSVLDLSCEGKVRQWIFSQPDVYCNPYLETELPSWSHKNFRWKKVMSVASISKVIAGENKWGDLVNIKALKRGVSGRMYLARFVFEKDSFDVKGELTIRQLWHPSLRSSCFVVDKDDDHFILNGAGWGHGVGMCQSGAVAQAKQGAIFNSILQHYYQKAELMTLY
ncbi:MAG: SpoIID/LytB domain-containing protein, partial [Calditrichia bacterium]|nr:SpoIID/LytB domain-containing protein [Calditrichia bacterium]